MKDIYRAKIYKVCAACGRSTDLDLDRQSEEFGSAIDEHSVNQVYGTLVCDHCRDEKVKLVREDGLILVDPRKISSCDDCGNPISIPRLEAQADTNICTFCMRALRKDNLNKKHHPKPIQFDEDLIPEELKRCPQCGSRTLLKKNRKTGERFIGCLAFPVCRWTSSISD